MYASPLRDLRGRVGASVVDDQIFDLGHAGDLSGQGCQRRLNMLRFVQAGNLNDQFHDLLPDFILRTQGASSTRSIVNPPPSRARVCASISSVR